MNSLFTILVVLVLAIAGQAVKPKDCGSKATSLKIKVSGCEDADAVCPFITGQNVTLTAEFTAATDIQSATIQLAGVIGIVKIPFPLNPNEACGNWGLKCPVAAGSPQVLQVQLPIQKSYPKIKVGVMMQLISGKDKIICTSFPAQIKSA